MNQNKSKTKGNYKKGDKNKKFTGKSMKKEANVALIEDHPKFSGVFIARNKDDFLLTKNMAPGSSVYGERRISKTSKSGITEEYRVWNCYRSKLAAGIVCGLSNIWIGKGVKVLYLGAANGTTISHVSEIVGEDTLVYAVEFSKRSGADLISLAAKRKNIVPIIADARRPDVFRMIVPMVDVIFSDVSQADQSKIVMDNANYFLKNNGKILISIKAPCIDSKIPPQKVFMNEANWLKKHDCKLKEMVTLEPYERHHAIISAVYTPENRTTYQ